MTIWNLASGEATRKLEQEQGLSRAIFTADGNTVTTISGRNTFTSRDINEGRVTRTWTSGNKDFFQVAVSADDRIATTLLSGRIHMFYSPTASEISSWQCMIPKIENEGPNFFFRASVNDGLFLASDWIAYMGNEDFLTVAYAPEIRTPVPEWLPDFIEAVVRQKVGPDLDLHAVDPVSSKAILASMTDTGASYGSLARWLLEDRGQHFIHPSSKASTRAYQHGLPSFYEDYLSEWLALFRLCPTNAVATAALGFYLSLNDENDAAFLLNRAAALAPGRPEVDFWRGMGLAVLKQYAEAEPLLTTATRADRFRVDKSRVRSSEADGLCSLDCLRRLHAFCSEVSELVWRPTRNSSQ